MQVYERKIYRRQSSNNECHIQVVVLIIYEMSESEQIRLK